MATGASGVPEVSKLLLGERLLSAEDTDRHARLYAEIQQCRVDMVYGSLLARWRLQRRLVRADEELGRLLLEASTPL